MIAIKVSSRDELLKVLVLLNDDIQPGKLTDRIIPDEFSRVVEFLSVKPIMMRDL